MTTLRQLVTDAYRESGLSQIGLVLENDEFDEGLRKIKTIINSLYGNEMGVPLAPVSYGSVGLTRSTAKELDAASYINQYFVAPNTQLLCNTNEVLTLYLHPNPKDGARLAIADLAQTFGTNAVTVNANGRRIESASSVILNTNGANKKWFYRQDLGTWTLISDLTADSESPFPGEFDDFLILMTAMRINPRHKEVLAPESVAEMQRLRRAFRSRYKQVVQVLPDIALVRLPSMYPNGSGADGSFPSGLWNIEDGSLIFDGGGA